MSLRVAWSLLSRLTWFRSKYQQFTGDNRFWSFLRSEEGQNYIQFKAALNSWVQSLGQAESHNRWVLSPFFLLWGFRRPGHLIASASAFSLYTAQREPLAGGSKYLDQNTSGNLHSWHGPRALPCRADGLPFSCNLPTEEGNVCLRKNLLTLVWDWLWFVTVHNVCFECSDCCWKRNLASFAFHGK